MGDGESWLGEDGAGETAMISFERDHFATAFDLAVGCAKSRAKILPHATTAGAILRTRYAT
jgi:hypothetical protein